MRRLIAAVLGIVAVACASYGAPPGGPERHEPPRVLAITPDSGATNVRSKEVNFRFDEVVSDRPPRGDLDQYFLISPRDGSVNVSWHRQSIAVRPRKGFRANTAYAVTLLPGLGDLRGNVMKHGTSIVFSTGPNIPRFGVVGTAWDWVSQRPAANVLIEAIRRPDSVVYIAAADSTGAFSIGPFPPGTYTIRGWADANNNRALDPGEIWDSTRVTADTARPIVELLLIARDTLGPRLQSVSAQDSLTLQLTFDKPVNPADTLTAAQFLVQRSDSAPIGVARVLTPAEAAREQAARDSVRRDSAQGADTTRRPPSRQPVVPLPTPVTSGRAAVAKPPPAKPSKPAPSPNVVIRLASPVESGKTYRVTARGVRNVVGRPATTARTIAVPKPSPPARADTTRPPPARPARPPRR